MTDKSGPIGVFDSGYGGLTVFQEIIKQLPQYDYLYLGDNARVPYGTRSFETVYHYTKECVTHLMRMGCRLVIVACNTASAKALRTIQQNDLPTLGPLYKVLGVIRPTTEIIGRYTQTGKIGILATPGTVSSGSYEIEIKKFFPEINVYQQACPMWVPLIENDEHESAGADYFVRKYIDNLFTQCGEIDVIALACTHYPLLINKIYQFIPANIKLFSQGEIVASSLVDYLKRHPEINELCSRGGHYEYYTTDSPMDFNEKAALFTGKSICSRHLQL